ncbi:hypothetical protein [Piscinibacterium candidicorallinum]|uniref:YCII-related domain-containing protein n=1 Tax=Piscinibacterium candidicorallinum TaxID=1793872 RepID=A0ABV7H1K0_9BURK
MPDVYRARVYCYSDIDARHSSTEAWQRAWGEKLPDFAQLVVCEFPDQAGGFLLGLSEDGIVFFDSQHESLSVARAYAESEFEGLRDTWVFPEPS